MTNKKALNVKNMVDTYMNARMDMNKVWDSFRCLYLMGFISYEEWKRFFDKCHAWIYDEETSSLLDMNDNVIKRFE